MAKGVKGWLWKGTPNWGVVKSLNMYFW